MGKRILISSLVVILLFGMAGVMAQTAIQQVTVTVTLGIIDINSPAEKLYQENNIPLTLSVTTPRDISTISMTDNGKMSYLCSKCNAIEKSIYFSNGKHSLNITVKFKNGEIISREILFEVDSGSEVYIMTSAGLKKATARDIANLVLYYNFTIAHMNDFAPEDSCSVRAKGGNATVNGINFGSNNKLNFYSITSIEQGQGEFSSQLGRKFFSFKFKVNQTIENSNKMLELEIYNTKTKEKMILEFDKIENLIKILDNKFSVESMNINFLKGCSTRKKGFYLLEKGKRFDRSIEEARQIILDNPIFVGNYESLKSLFSLYWRIWRIFI